MNSTLIATQDNPVRQQTCTVNGGLKGTLGYKTSNVMTAPRFRKNQLVRLIGGIGEIHNPKLARLLCKMIPAHCPFERDIKFLGHFVFHIPPLCKLNPLYEQVVSLRFKALSYLADECGEDVTPYCQ